MSENNQLDSTKTGNLIFPEVSSVDLSAQVNKLIQIMPEHQQMLEIVKESHPEIHRASSLFYKTQSQFMDNMLTVSAPTPIRNMRQILAEMNRTREALKEAAIKLRKKEIELGTKKRELANDSLELRMKRVYLEDLNIDAYKAKALRLEIEDLEEKELDRKDMLETEIAEILTSIDATRGYISGAIRKLANYTEQYNMIVEKHGLKDLSEEQFEKEEERYHIMKAFDQALCAARSHHMNLVDEGNMIYFTQIGINGASAQREISEFLTNERELMRPQLDEQGNQIMREPTHGAVLHFLNRMADKYQGCAVKLAEHKGMKTVTNTALIHSGDKTLIENKGE